MGEITQQWSIFCNRKKKDKGTEVKKRGGRIRDYKVREAGVPHTPPPPPPITIECFRPFSIITSSQPVPFTHLPCHRGILFG